MRTVDGDDAEAWAFSGWAEHTCGQATRSKQECAGAEGIRDASDDAMAHTLMVLANTRFSRRTTKRFAPPGGRVAIVEAQRQGADQGHLCVGPMHEEFGDKEGAIERFKEVADMRWADYEWVFQGNIQQAMTYERRNGSSEAVVELLEDMLDDKKNEEFLDQVYFALGEVALEDRRRDESFELFKKSVAAHVDMAPARVLSWRTTWRIWCIPPRGHTTTARWCTWTKTTSAKTNHIFGGGLGKRVDNLNIRSTAFWTCVWRLRLRAVDRVEEQRTPAPPRRA